MDKNRQDLGVAMAYTTFVIVATMLGLSATGCKPAESSSLVTAEAPVVLEPSPTPSPTPEITISPTPTPSPSPTEAWAPKHFNYAPDRPDCWINGIMTNGSSYIMPGHSYYSCSDSDGYPIYLGFYDNGGVSIGGDYFTVTGLPANCDFVWDEGTQPHPYAYAVSITTENNGYLTGIRLAKWITAQNQFGQLVDYTCILEHF